MDSNQEEKTKYKPIFRTIPQNYFRGGGFLKIIKRI